eukprot:TRINITY_DN42799_c0_g1_i1.p2 TRINITY_DN42799_c0_g1~~TRINITY_DN42799_c0_g1_i1.p2  ORF type:complete len:246 (-),score=77.91 TRINITY_DN42799_c0_g1_i1:196-933(-)
MTVAIAPIVVICKGAKVYVNDAAAFEQVAVVLGLCAKAELQKAGPVDKIVHGWPTKCAEGYGGKVSGAVLKNGVQARCATQCCGKVGPELSKGDAQAKDAADDVSRLSDDLLTKKADDIKDRGEACCLDAKFVESLSEDTVVKDRRSEQDVVDEMSLLKLSADANEAEQTLKGTEKGKGGASPADGEDAGFDQALQGMLYPRTQEERRKMRESNDKLKKEDIGEWRRQRKAWLERFHGQSRERPA